MSRSHSSPVIPARKLGVLFVLLLVLQLGLGGLLPIAAQADGPDAISLPPQIIIESGRDEQIRIPAPEFTRRAPGAANISVNYSGFTSQAQTAFQAAVNIWANLIESPVPIIISATFSPLGANVLGQAGPTQFLRNFPNAPLPNVFYPIALANSYAGTDLNSGIDDIQAQFSSNFSNWYYGTDGNTPAGKIDFISVVLHELCHGLGFISSMKYSSGSGSWGFAGNPLVFDRFIINGSGQSLTNTAIFPNNSAALGSQLTSNNVFLSSPTSKAINGNNNVKLYAPSTWLPGSSISHLDYNTYAGTSNRLMVYSMSSGSSIQNPGQVTLSMFQDMGWKLSNPIVLIPPPTAPANLQASTASESQLNLSWGDTSSNEDGFKIERKTGAGGTYVQVANAPTNAVSYGDKGLVPNTTYFYRIRAYNAGGNSSYTGEVSALTAPAVPLNLALSGLPTSNQINLSWSNPAPTGTGLSLERRSESGAYSVIAGSLSPATTTYPDAGLPPGAIYSYRIRSFNSGGFSNYSNVLVATTAGDFVVRKTTDAGEAIDQDNPDTLSFALKRATSGQSITFALTSGTTVTVSGPLRNIPAGVTIGGGCGATGPNIIIKADVAAGVFDGLTLNGGATLGGLQITKFKGKQLKPGGNGNKLICVEATK